MIPVNLDDIERFIVTQEQQQRLWRQSLPNYPLPCFRDDGTYVVEEVVELIDVLMRDNPHHARNNDKEFTTARKREELADAGRMIFDMLVATNPQRLPVAPENEDNAKIIDALLNLARDAIEVRRYTDPAIRLSGIKHLVHRWLTIAAMLEQDPAELLAIAREKQTRKRGKP